MATDELRMPGPPRPGTAGAVPGHPAEKRRAVFRAEWDKLRTLPSTWWLLLATMVLTTAVGAAAAASLRTQCRQGGDCSADFVKSALTGVWVGQAAVVVLAVLTVAGEYATGTMRATFTAVPDRLRVVAAKASLLGLLTAVAGAFGVVGSLLVARAILPTRGSGALQDAVLIPLRDGSTVRAAVGSVLYLVLIAWLSVGVSFLLRDIAGTTGTVLGLLYLFPLLATLVSEPAWEDRLRKLGPGSAGLSIQATRHLDTLPIAPWPGVGVLAAYSAMALICGVAVVHRRDV